MTNSRPGAPAALRSTVTSSHMPVLCSSPSSRISPGLSSARARIRFAMSVLLVGGVVVERQQFFDCGRADQVAQTAEHPVGVLYLRDGETLARQAADAVPKAVDVRVKRCPRATLLAEQRQNAVRRVVLRAVELGAGAVHAVVHVLDERLRVVVEPRAAGEHHHGQYPRIMYRSRRSARMRRSTTISS